MLACSVSRDTDPSLKRIPANVPTRLSIGSVSRDTDPSLKPDFYVYLHTTMTRSVSRDTDPSLKRGMELEGVLLSHHVRSVEILTLH